MCGLLYRKTIIISSCAEAGHLCHANSLRVTEETVRAFVFDNYDESLKEFDAERLSTEELLEIHENSQLSSKASSLT